MVANAPITSPCQLICTLDLKSGLCFGCGRSRGEIALWTRYSDEQREKIMEKLPERMAELGAAQ